MQAEILDDPSPVSVRLTAKANRELLAGRDVKDDLDLMRQCLKLKVDQHPDLKDKLKTTGDRLIVEDCTARQRGDALYWGMAQVKGQWVGENWLGLLWMEVRGKL